MKKADLSFLDLHGPLPHTAPPCNPPSGYPPPGNGQALLFESLYTKEGLRKVRGWFRRNATSAEKNERGERKKNENDVGETERDRGQLLLGGKEPRVEDNRHASDERVKTNHNGSNTNGKKHGKSKQKNKRHKDYHYYFTEPQFVEFVRRFVDCSDCDALEFFDLFDRQTGRVEFPEFFLLISALCAHESASLTQFLYLHGKQVFALLSDPRANSLTFERFSKFGLILGVPEELLLTKLSELGHHTFHRLDLDRFMIFYFDVFSCIDNFRKKNKSSTTYSDALLGENSHTSKKNKDCIIS